MQEWYLAKVLGMDGEVCRNDGLIWGYVSRPLSLPGSNRIVPFPRLSRKRGDSAMAEMTGYYKERRVAPWATVGRVMTPDYARRELKVWGFQYLSAAVCMAADLNRMAPSEPEGRIDISPTDDLDKALPSQHPSYGPRAEEGAHNSIASAVAMAQRQPKRVWNFLAYHERDVVGSAMLFVGHGVAGIYDVAVVPRFRRRKAGAGIVWAVCSLARELGFGIAVLQNDASLIPFYSGLGFRVVSTIEHWERPSGAPLPSDKERSDARRPVTLGVENFLTAMLTHKSEEAARLLKAEPQIVAASIPGAGGATPLHLAAYHGLSFATRMLIESGADIERRDDKFQSTPLGWALHGLGRYGPVIKQDQLGAAIVLLRSGASFSPELRRLLVDLDSESRETIQKAADDSQ